ncbi:MAG: PIN domain-containing protein [Elusimicrobiota bacterium]|nr:PIN domain-containing protein [Elusimicrobiota bacterium]
MNKVLINTGPIVALFDKSDKYHKKVKTFLKEFSGKLITSIAVITEVTHILDFNIKTQLNFLEWIRRGAIGIHEINELQLDRIIKLMKKYSDQPMDFSDATLIIIAEEINTKNIISIDNDFDIYRIKGKTKFKNLLS